MAVILECPHCEARFSIEKLAAHVNCPSCHHPFQPPVEFARQEPASPPPPPRSAPAAFAAAPRRLQTAPSEPPRVSSGPPPVRSATSPEPSGLNIEAGHHGTSVYPHRQKKNLGLTLASWAMAIATIGGLFAIVAILSQSAKNGNTDEAAVNEPSPDEPDEATGGPAPSDPLDTARTKRLARTRQPAVEPVDETPVFFSARQWEVAWNAINGYVVKLDVQTPLRTRTLTGLIVDSRGWVLTSLSGLQDAGQVTVTLAGKNLSDDPPWRELSDLSRGIIATDDKLDLALISINRTQVINLADVELEAGDRIAAAQRLLIARTPPPRHQRWLAECRIDQRGTLDRLDEDTRQSVQQAGLSEQVDWIIYPPRQPTDLSSQLAGSPLIDLDGRVVAFNTGLTAGDRALAIPARRLRTFLESVPDPVPQPQPFSRAADLVRQASGESTPESFSAAREFEDTLGKLMEAIAACRKTDWTAETAEEFTALQSLAEHLDAAQDWLARNLTTVEEPEKYDELLQAAMDEITLSLEDDLEFEEYEAGKGNEFFEEQVTPRQPWFFVFAEVEWDQFNSRRFQRQDTVVFRLLGTGEHLLAPLFGDGRSFRQGRKFLLLGKLHPRGSLKTDQFAGESSVRLIHVFTYFELTRRRP